MPAAAHPVMVALQCDAVARLATPCSSRAAAPVWEGCGVGGRAERGSQSRTLLTSFEDVATRAVGGILRRAGWSPRLEPYTSYGTPHEARLLARVVLGNDHATHAVVRRGIRSLFVAQVPAVPVRVRVEGGVEITLVSDRAGYVDAEIPIELAPGWHRLEYLVEGRPPVPGRLRILSDAPGVAIVSDVDDTIMVTGVPRPFLAAWNTLVRDPRARAAVPGMADFYREILARRPDSEFFYVSTGSWNSAPTLRRFIERHRYPDGPLLLRHWGPATLRGSGAIHKKSSLDSLMTMFPQMQWMLVGDDGQLDPRIYAQAVQRYPGRVRAIVIRQLTPAQQVLAHGNPVAYSSVPDGVVPIFLGRDGDQIGRQSRAYLDAWLGPQDLSGDRGPS